MPDLDLLCMFVALTPVWPMLGAVVIALLMLPRGRPSERLVALVGRVMLVASLLGALAGVALRFVSGPVDYRLGDWYHAADESFPLVFLFDGLSASVSLLIAVLLLTTASFSRQYLHREPGFIRFFLLMLVFGAGMHLLVLAGSVELLFIGPVQAAIRVLVTYRLCDIGLLLCGVFLHQWLHTTVWVDSFRGAATESAGLSATAVALGLVFAAMGKSAQFPVGGWLPRAMEGPTASSAVFYGSLSVHAGVYLLLRAAPLIEHSLAARIALVIVGTVTAVMAALSSQVSADAKSAVAYATASQVGLMFVACGLGFYTLATVHLIAHATLRYYQFLRTPSALQDALARRAALGRTEQDEAAALWEGVGLRRRRFIYRLALERFAVETALDRWVTRPIMSLSRWLDGLEHRFLALHDRPVPVRRSDPP